MTKPRAVEGVNESNWNAWPNPSTPAVADRKEEREVLLVDRHGAPLIVKVPRPVGFRKP